MVDRHWFGDLGLAIALALPLASLALPTPATPQAKSAHAGSRIASADRIAGTGRIGLLG